MIDDEFPEVEPPEPTMTCPNDLCPDAEWLKGGEVVLEAVDVKHILENINAHGGREKTTKILHEAIIESDVIVSRREWTHREVRATRTDPGCSENTECPTCSTEGHFLSGGPL